MAAAPFLLASGVGSAIGSIRSGNMAKAAADREAAMMQQQAEITMRDGLAQDELGRTQARQQIGLQLAASAESGGGINADQLRQSVYDAELDSASIRYGVQNKARSMNDQATVTRWEGKQKRTAGYINAANQLLSSAGQAYGMKGMPGAKAGG